MSWRPKGWKCPYITLELDMLGNPSILERIKYEAFEAGADAMFEALDKMDWYVNLGKKGKVKIITSAYSLPKNSDKWVKGKFVFIPEEEK